MNDIEKHLCALTKRHLVRRSHDGKNELLPAFRNGQSIDMEGKEEEREGRKKRRKRKGKGGEAKENGQSAGGQ